MQYSTEPGHPLIGITAAGSRLPSSGTMNCDGDAPRVVPVHRWDVDGATTAARFGSFIENADMFDAAAFNISR